MRKILLAFLLLASPTFAQPFQAEVRRSVEVPGFFMVHIVPSTQVEALPKEDVFVTHFRETEAPAYRELLPVLQELGATVLNKQELSEIETSPEQRVIVLGKTFDNHLNFTLQNEDNVLEQFERFSDEFLSDIFVDEVNIELGGNTFEVYPSHPRQMTSQGLTLVGKFQRPMKTRLVLRGKTHEGLFTQVLDLPLNNPLLSQGWESQNIPDFWEESYKKAHPPKPKPKPQSPTPSDSENKTDDSDFSAGTFDDWFPWIIAAAGLLLLLLAARWARNSKDPSQILENALEQGAWPEEKSLPFEVEKQDPS